MGIEEILSARIDIEIMQISDMTLLQKFKEKNKKMCWIFNYID